MGISIMIPICTITGVDFTSESFTITIPATEDRPPGLIYEDIQQDDIVPRFMVNDDNMNEITQSFALVAVLGDDVPDRFACFQRQFGDTDCFGRTGATSIIIVDNDGMFSVTENVYSLSEGLHMLCRKLKCMPTHSIILYIHQVVDTNICIAGFSQQCYSQPNCEAGSEIGTPADGPTPRDCCIGTNEGQSYADSGGNCIVEQCVGKRSITYQNHKKSFVFKFYPCF